MKNSLIYILLFLAIGATITKCKSGVGTDDIQSASKIWDVDLAFYYHNEEDFIQILEHLNLYTKMFNCNDKEYNRYIITMNSIVNNQIDTVISKPSYSENVDKNNLTINTNWSNKCLMDFKQKAIPHNPNRYLSEKNKTLLDSAYLKIISKYAINYLFISDQDRIEYNMKNNIISDLDTLKYAIDTAICAKKRTISIIWNPHITSDTSATKEPIVALPKTKEAQINKKGILEKKKNLTWKETYELASLKAETNDRIESIWTYLNTAAKMSIDANESDSIYQDIQLPIVESRFSRLRSDSPGKWRGLLAGLDRGDKNLIGVILGPINRPNVNGCFPINLLVPYTESSTGNFNPQYKLTTTSLSRLGSLVFNFDLLIENRNEWESRDNISLPSGGNITIDYNISKKKVTIENNTIPGNSFANVCLRFTDILDTTDNGDNGSNEDSGKQDNNIDNDHDGFIGYLDINDNDKKKFPDLKLGEANLGDNFDFRVANGDGLDDVEYKWYINGVQVQRPYIFKEIGCYDIQLKLTHIPTGKTKDLSSTLHVKLPLFDLDRDLNAILRVGSYTYPAVPPSSEKLMADEAEKRVLSYFASGCNHTVTNQFNQQKSIEELIVADLRGAKGKIHNIKVKSIAYKNNGCNKICSFVYEIGQ